MKALSVLLPYRNRLANFRVLAKNLKVVDKSDVAFHLISLGDRNQVVRDLCEYAGIHYHYMDYNGLFSIGLAHNFGAHVARGEYILKQDIDCMPYVGLYDRLLRYIDVLRLNPASWANIGAFSCNQLFSEEYLNDMITVEIYNMIKSTDEYKLRFKNACGNCFLVRREHYVNLGGTSDRFVGWGFEDYQIIYYLEKSFRSDFVLSSYGGETIAAVCREEIGRPKNAITNDLDLAFLHRWHDIDVNERGYTDNINQNCRVLLDLVTSFTPARGRPTNSR